MVEHRALERPRTVEANSSICQTYVFIYAQHTHLTYRTTRHPLWSLLVNMEARRRGTKISTAENWAVQMFQRLQMFHKPKKTEHVCEKRISSRLFLIQREEHFWFERSLRAFLRSLTKRAKQQPSGSGLRKRFKVEECRDQFLLTMWCPEPEQAWKGTRQRG